MPGVPLVQYQVFHAVLGAEPSEVTIGEVGFLGERVVHLVDRGSFLSLRVRGQDVLHAVQKFRLDRLGLGEGA